jgi:VanZ family protein
VSSRPPSAPNAPGTQVSVRTGRAAGLVVLVLVICGSLTPFQFDWARPSHDGWNGPIGLAWSPSSLSDIAVNLMVYLPVGAILYGWVRPMARRRVATILIATFAGAGLSLALEVLQTMSPARCASWIDVVVNSFGALLGAVAAPAALQAGKRLIERSRRAFMQAPMSTVGLLLTLGLIVHGVTPFDFVLADREFNHGLMRSLWWPMAERAAATPADGELAPYAPLVSAIGMAGAFALLGCVGAMANRQRGLPPLAALWGSIGHGTAVAVLLEVLQLFVRSHVFDTADIATNAVAAAIGAWSAVAVLDPLAAARDARSPASAFPAFLIGAFVLAQIACAALRAVSSVEFSWTRPNWTDMAWVPFAAQFRMPFLTALGSMASSFLTYVLLATTAALYEWRRFSGVRWGRISLMVVATVTLCEMAQFGTRGHVADLTELIVALLAVATCRAAWFTLVPPPEASPQATK